MSLAKMKGLKTRKGKLRMLFGVKLEVLKHYLQINTVQF